MKRIDVNTELCIRCNKRNALPFSIDGPGHGGQLCQYCEDLQEREYIQWEAEQRAKGYLRPDRAKIIMNALSNEPKRRLNQECPNCNQSFGVHLDGCPGDSVIETKRPTVEQ
jgi:hypothetical protein